MSTFHPGQSPQGCHTSLEVPPDFHLPQLDEPFHAARMNTGYATTWGVAGPCGYQDLPKTESIIEEQADEQHPTLMTSMASLRQVGDHSRSEEAETNKVNLHPPTDNDTRRSSLHPLEFSISRLR